MFKLQRQHSRHVGTSYFAKLTCVCIVGGLFVCFLLSHLRETNINATAVQIVQVNQAFDPIQRGKPEKTLEEIYSEVKCDTVTKKTNKLCKILPPQDLTSLPPLPFLKNYKNPCWRDVAENIGSGPSIRCLPYFYVLGAPRCGSTDLYTRMEVHPQVINAEIKDNKWLTSGRYAFETDEVHSAPNLESYTDIFVNVTTEITATFDKNNYHHKVFGDFSIGTMWDNMFTAKYASISNTTQHRTATVIHNLLKDTKFIVPIRDPVTRAYSDYLFFDEDSRKTREIFHEFVVEGIRTHYECLEYQTLQFCIDYRPNNRGKSGRLFIGLYQHHLQDYFKYFKRDQFVVFRLEDYSKNITKYLSRIYSFLDLDNVSEKDYKAMVKVKTTERLLSKEAKALGNMLPETRTLLEDFYRPYNEKLAGLLGQEFNYNMYYNNA